MFMVLQKRAQKNEERVQSLMKSLKRGASHLGDQRSPAGKQQQVASAGSSALSTEFADCVTWSLARVSAQLQISVGCERDQVNKVLRGVVESNDLSGTAVACLEFSEVIKLFDDALSSENLKTVGLLAAVSFFLQRMKAHM